jgi:hypothetical protein
VPGERPRHPALPLRQSRLSALAREERERLRAWEHGWTQETTQEWRWYYAGTLLPFRSDWMSAPLHYVEEDGGQYQVWAHVGDAENRVGDRNANNNYGFIVCPPFLKPATFREEMTEPLRRETRMEDGKLTSTLTIGGKPIK